jgi:hypothetical protein
MPAKRTPMKVVDLRHRRESDGAASPPAATSPPEAAPPKSDGRVERLRDSRRPTAADLADDALEGMYYSG